MAEKMLDELQQQTWQQGKMRAYLRLMCKMQLLQVHLQNKNMIVTEEYYAELKREWENA